MQIDTADFISPPYPKFKDKLLTINDSVATGAILSKNFSSPNTPGTESSITFLSKTDTLKTTVKSRQLTREQIVAQATIMLTRFLISICYLALGIWAFAKRPNSGAVRSLTLFCFAMSGFMMTVVTMIGANFSTLSLPLLATLTTILNILVIFVGAFWINLQLLFPAPREFVKKHPIAAYALCYLPMAILITVMEIKTSQILGFILIGLLTLQIGFGFYMLGRFYGKAKDMLEKRQARLVIWGTGVGLGLLFLFILFMAAATEWAQRIPEYYIMAALMVVYLGLLLSPLSFAYAFGKYRLMEIEGHIRRGTQQFLIGFGLLALFYLMVYIISNFTLDFLHVESRTTVLISALALAVVFAPAQRKLLGQLNKWIYPERFRLQGILNDFLTQSTATSDNKSFWDGLENRLKAALKVETIYPIIRATDNGHFVFMNSGVTPFEIGSPFVSVITGMGGKPLMRDELEASTKTKLTESEKNWFAQHNVALILPLVTHSELIGFLCIGSKSERQDFEPKDFEVLKSLSNQIAIAADNILLLEENVEKKRMEAELSIARQVQEKMLPRDIPSAAGLEIAAMSKFCTEVAGDYYDVIDTGDGRTVLAIGDVSGKGAAAALLMSNVQASLRTAIGIEAQMESDNKSLHDRGIQLSGIVSNINKLIFRNSQPEQFITFFVALFDPSTKKLEYINAGHNPPLVVSRSGVVQELTEGGVLLGIMPELPYKTGSVQLSDGDLLFLYTDGLSEAARADEEMFGEERIKQFLAANTSLEPATLLENIEKEVALFIREEALADDFTLLCAKVK
jgi:serine phosphatase RsbU (regulator of sigma subunit)